MASGQTNPRNAYLKIIDQPASTRFRYLSEAPLPSVIEGKGGGCLSIKIENYTGPVSLVVSLVSADKPYKQHPFMLKGDDWEPDAGYFKKKIADGGNRLIRLANLNLIQTAEEDYAKVLKARKNKKGVKAFRDINIADSLQEVDKHRVRLAFHAYLKTDSSGRYDHPLPTVYSNPIINKKSELKIMTLSHTRSACAGGQRMILLTSKTTKDVNVRFYKEKEGKTVWEADGDVETRHSGWAIVLKTPKFEMPECKLDENHPSTHVKIQLYRKTKKKDAPDSVDCSEPYSFKYVWMLADCADSMYNLMDRRKRSARTQVGFSEPPKKQQKSSIAAAASVGVETDDKTEPDPIVPSTIGGLPSSSSSGGSYSRHSSRNVYQSEENVNSMLVDERFDEGPSTSFHPGDPPYQQAPPDLGGTTGQSEVPQLDPDGQPITPNSLEKLLKSLPEVGYSSPSQHNPNPHEVYPAENLESHHATPHFPGNQYDLTSISVMRPGTANFSSIESVSAHSLSDISASGLISATMDTGEARGVGNEDDVSMYQRDRRPP